MPLLDIFKKKQEKKPEKKEQKVKKVIKEKIEKKPVKKAVEKKVQPERKKRKILFSAYKSLKSPHVTEKATDLTAKNQYVFKVWPRSNKKQIKEAVEDVFGIDVDSVRIINIHSKKIRIGKTKGQKPGYKKAIVKVREGQKIEILPR